MTLDVNTLFLLTMYVEAILGILLLLIWVQNPGIAAVAWWASAHLLRSLSIALFGMYGSVPDLVSIDFAGALLFTSFGVTWNGARVFSGREPLPGSLMTGAALWILASQFAGFTEVPNLRALLSAGIIAAFSWAAAYEFWCERREGLVSRWPAVLLLFACGTLFLLRTPLSAQVPSAARDGALSSAWLTVLSAEALLFTIAVAFVLLAMAKERAELRHRTAAMLDPLTGLANRRAFMEQAQELTRLQVRRARPVAVFVIDLDHFKTVNDSFGHPIGDHVLRIFADVMRANLRSTDIVGRLGGEEFAVLLADADKDNAFVVAERLRTNFAAACAVVDGHAISATISVGVAIIEDPRDEVGILLAQADRALYQAKAAGRNRVALAPLRFPQPGASDGEVPAGMKDVRVAA